ncbi:wax ester/triacylglycerol synthase domain-containing protein [Blastococcus litoris]|uniref:wax ester/triacylglycerol synthase domain-containing protein n=1 Tax=Blastococcus litoris TaxID=2171622 RepID=UPI0013DEBCB7|nr:wax ester/triacylglycerol synthase domain-containing protein [Blastococcus litoris]
MAVTRLRMDELVNAWVADSATPFQIALVGRLDAAPFRLHDGALDVRRIRRELAARARRVEDLRRRVVWTRCGEGMPVWAPDPAFDPDRHIAVATLPPGRDLASWAAGRIVRPLPMDRPLWRAEVVDGLPGARFGLVVVVHHVAADGLAGVRLAGSLLDGAPGVDVPAPPPHLAPPLPSHRELRAAHVQELARALRRVRVPTRPRPGRVRELVRELRSVSAELRTPTSATSLPRRVGPTRQLAVVREPLADLRRSGHALGVTVNDLLLAAVTGGLRALLTSRGEAVSGMTLRASVPVVTGRGVQASGVLLVDLPVGDADPLRRLASIRAATTRAKRRHHTGPAGVASLVHLPIPLARLVMRWMRRFGASRVTLFVTDVPGPAAPLWLAGARLLDAVPVAPLVQRVGLGVAALS